MVKASLLLSGMESRAGKGLERPIPLVYKYNK